MGPSEHSWPGDLTTVETEFGEFAAVDDGEITRIRNIRYARAERFAPPIPVEPDPSRGIRTPVPATRLPAAARRERRALRRPAARGRPRRGLPATLAHATVGLDR